METAVLSGVGNAEKEDPIGSNSVRIEDPGQTGITRASGDIQRWAVERFGSVAARLSRFARRDLAEVTFSILRELELPDRRRGY